MSTAPVWASIKDRHGRYRYINPVMEARFAARLGTDWYGRRDSEMWPAEIAALIRANDEAALRGDALDVFTQVLPIDGTDHRFLTMKFALTGMDGERLIGSIGVDLSQNERIEAERDRLANAIEQVAESVMIADLDARITYVNPAFERITGYTREEVIGKNPRLLSSGEHGASFYEAMWAALTTGQPWVADFINRRKDGSLFSEEGVISPIRDSSGAMTSYVAVKRDVTHERALEERSVQIIRERALIADTIRGIGPRDTPEDSAQAICRQVASLTGMAGAYLLVFDLDGRAMPLGYVVTGRPDPPLHRIPIERSRQLRQRAADGPWVESWVDRPRHPYNDLMIALGPHLIASAPIHYDGRLIGLLGIDAANGVGATIVSDNLPALVEFADLAGILIGRDVAERTEIEQARAHVQTMIDERAFHPVFQPIVDIESDAIVGYEALSRFDDEVAPDVRFAQAASVGLGAELEIATLRAAIDDAVTLPDGAWLNLNVTPDLILAGDRLATLLADCPRRVVLEVTEHQAIADYPAFRDAIRRLGPEVDLAIDDAGAGFASLRHIIELRPAFVKLDRSLVAGVDQDEALQAMIAGLCHFARTTGCYLLAEGVETQAELDMVASLSIPFAQGFLLGRPKPAARALQAAS